MTCHTIPLSHPLIYYTIYHITPPLSPSQVMVTTPATVPHAYASDMS